MGWMWDRTSFEAPATNVKELYRLPELKALQRYYPLLILAQGLAFYGLGAFLGKHFPNTGTTGAQMVVWAFLISTVALWHATFMVNSVCHVWGKRPHETADTSTNNSLVALLTLGEGWHNNHHKFPYSSRHGLEWWQADLTYLSLRGLASFGIVADLKMPRRPAAAT